MKTRIYAAPAVKGLMHREGLKVKLAKFIHVYNVVEKGWTFYHLMDHFN